MANKMEFLEKKIDNLKVIVFDLDYTLWPMWIDTHVDPPFRKRPSYDPNDSIVDRNGRKVKYYDEVPQVLERLRELGYELAVASRTTEIKGAFELLELLEWTKHFQYLEIYPGCKITHINKIAKESGAKMSEILFFDDEMRNIRDLESIGVKSILVDEGVGLEVVSVGIKVFVNRHLE